jgi:hypothetical protein
MSSMAWSLDARLPLHIVESAEALAAALATGSGPAAVLAEAPPPPALPAGAAALVSFDPWMPHGVACGCCGGRSPAAVALDRLFQARVRGQCAWFDRVLALAETPEARQEVATALRDDVVPAARLRAA